MPAGMSWPRYLTFAVVSLLTSFAGAQVVHQIYRPLDDLEDLVQQELERRKKAKEMNPV